MLAAPSAPRARDAWRRLVARLEDPAEGVASPAASAWTWLRSNVDAHPTLADIAVVVAVAAVTSPSLVNSPPDVTRSLLVAALLVPLAWRRRAPVAVFGFLSVVALLQWSLDERLVADVSLLVAVYTVADLRSRRTAAVCAGVLEAGAVLASWRWPIDGSGYRSLVFLTTATAAAALLGVTVRGRRARVAALTERAQRLERERDSQARLAAAAERTRIAREMHDVLAHSLAVIISQADGAAAKLDQEPERAREAIAHVAEIGRQSLRDTRQLLGVLRADDHRGDTHPQPAIDQIDELVAGVRATGLDASVTRDGPAFDVPPAAGLSVYRIVQEALTNTLKHADGVTAVAVRLHYADPLIRVEIVDDGRPAGAERSDRRAGHGLAGMRERAALHDGSVVAGPAAGGGWRVEAHLPIGPAGAP